MSEGNMGSSDGLEVLDPEVRTVKVGGSELKVQPLTVGQIPAIMRALKGINFSEGFSLDDIAGLLADHGDHLIEVIAVATRLPVDNIETMAPDEFLELATTVVEINSDFFVRRMLPTIRASMERAKKLNGGTGPIPSKP